MTDQADTAAEGLRDLLAPLLERRDELAANVQRLRDELVAEVARRKDAITVAQQELSSVDRVLKAGGLVAREQRKPRAKAKSSGASKPSDALLERTLAYVNEHDEVISRDVADALGVGQSSAGKALTYLRAEERIRLVRTEPASADGRGHRPVYGSWNGKRGT